MNGPPSADDLIPPLRISFARLHFRSTERRMPQENLANVRISRAIVYDSTILTEESVLPREKTPSLRPGPAMFT